MPGLDAGLGHVEGVRQEAGQGAGAGPGEEGRREGGGRVLGKARTTSRQCKRMYTKDKSRNPRQTKLQSGDISPARRGQGRGGSVPGGVEGSWDDA